MVLLKVTVEGGTHWRIRITYNKSQVFQVVDFLYKYLTNDFYLCKPAQVINTNCGPLFQLPACNLYLLSDCFLDRPHGGERRWFSTHLARTLCDCHPSISVWKAVSLPPLQLRWITRNWTIMGLAKPVVNFIFETNCSARNWHKLLVIPVVPLWLPRALKGFIKLCFIEQQQLLSWQRHCTVIKNRNYWCCEHLFLVTSYVIFFCGNRTWFRFFIEKNEVEDMQLHTWMWQVIGLTGIKILQHFMFVGNTCNVPFICSKNKNIITDVTT